MSKDADKKSRTDSSRKYTRYCLVILLAVFLLYSWLSLFTFSPKDPPCNVSYPPRPVSNAGGVLGSHIAYCLFLYWFGPGSYVLLASGTAATIIWLMGKKVPDLPWRLTGLVLLTISVAAITHLVKPHSPDGMLIGNGGILGIAVGDVLVKHCAVVGSWLILLAATAIAFMLLADSLVLRLPGLVKAGWERRETVVGPVRALIARLPRRQVQPAGAGVGLLRPVPVRNQAKAKATEKKEEEAPKVRAEQVDKNGGKGTAANNEEGIAERSEKESPRVVGGTAVSLPDDDVATDINSVTAVRPAGSPIAPPEAPVTKPAETVGQPQTSLAIVPKPAEPTDPSAAPAAVNTVTTDPAAPKFELTPQPIKAPKALPPIPKPKAAPPGEYQLPSAELLTAPKGGYIESQEAQVEVKRSILQQTLDDFGVQAQVVGQMTGPVISQFELALAPGVKVSQIGSLAVDMARALAVPGVRVVSPLPGRDTVGIEVPNLEKETVRLKELMALAPQAADKMQLPLYLGKDAGGGPIVADLAAMPHMLLAGTTGSGKSVCINTIIASMLLTRTPEQVRFILIDPKMVEMAVYEKVPHLLCPIVNDMRKAEDILQWAAVKMDERYELLKEAGVKNIIGFNKLDKEQIYQAFGATTDEEKAQIPTQLPYYVIIIDELADLVMTSSKEVEGHIIRIAQKARAVGIHLILATQRPSVNVVTGLIKSNMPCRISFRVASRQESRIVLDQNGADVLLGQGDMLFLQPGTSQLVRAQGTYVDDGELRSLVGHCRQGEPEYCAELVRLQTAPTDEEGGGEKDPLFDQAVEIILSCQRGSVSLLQRRLQVGYSRASRIVDQMAEAGILGDYKGSQARECMLTLDQWQQMKASVQADQTGESSADGTPTSV